jgi:hypothetical protein
MSGTAYSRIRNFCYRLFRFFVTMKSRVSILFFMLLFLGKVTGVISCIMNRDEIAVCDSDTQEEDSTEDSKECGDGEDEENSDDLYHQKETRFVLAGFIVREKFKVVNFLIPSLFSLEITSPPPEA